MSGISVIAGLGNPGQQYDGTRHNIGFAILDEFFSRCDTVRVKRKDPDAEVASVTAFGRELWLVKPMSFMNRSGEPLARVLKGQGKELSSLLVVHDDLDLPVGTLRLKVGGGEGGHNGLRSITEQLGGNGYARLRFGIGRPADPNWEIHRWVLSRFAAEERALVSAQVLKGIDVIEAVLKEGIKSAQNRFNGELKD